MENTNAKIIVITVFIVLFAAVICFLIYYTLMANKNSITTEQYETNIKRLQEQVKNKEKEIEEIKKTNEELLKQINELNGKTSEKQSTTTKQPTINKEAFNIIGQTLGEVKQKYGSNGKISGQGEGGVNVSLNNKWIVSVETLYEDYTDNDGVTHYKAEDTQKITSVRVAFKDLFNNYTKDCTTEKMLKKLFNKVNYYNEGYIDDFYFIEYGNYEIYVYCNNKIISDSSSVFIKEV